MAAAVVDALEVVDVQQAHRLRKAVAPRLGDLDVQGSEQRASIRQARERSGGRQPSRFVHERGHPQRAPELTRDRRANARRRQCRRVICSSSRLP